MRSNYRKLLEFIREVNIRNTDLSVDLLLGVSIQKIFIPSIANTIGTNMTNYKIVEKGQFVYGTVTSRNGDKVSIALLEEHEKAIVSQAYKVFEIVNHNELLPEYLMMWFKRPEFDRYARFHSHGSAREIFDWQDMCEVELPVPDIQTQQAIVDEYQAVQRKIALNEQLIKKLEETAQTIYQQWFVNFDFPDEKGNPYQSSGGEMEFSEELEKDIPKGWEVKELGEIIEIGSGKSPINKSDILDDFHKYPIYGAGGIMGYSSHKLFDHKILSMGRVGTHGVIQRIDFPCWTTDNTLVIETKFYEYLYQILKNLNYDEINRGGVQGLITQTDIKESKILKPNTNILDNFEVICGNIMGYYDIIKKNNDSLGKMKNLLLSKMASGER